ncbi:MAG: response regulator [bacterium]|nr:response regulator [bacterium]
MDEKTKVLIVDDNRDLANALRDAINHYNERWEATAVYDGSSVFNLIPTSFPDVVLCDIILPDMSGLDVMKNLKDYEQDIQIIIVTAYASLATAIEALQYGAFDYIPKPLHINQVIHAIKSAEARRRTLLENRRMIANLLTLKGDGGGSDEARRMVERIMVLKHFQKKLYSQDTKKKVLEASYIELSKIFKTAYVNIFLKSKDNSLISEVSSKTSEFKAGEKIDEKMPIFYFPSKNGLGCLFPEEKSMTSVIGFEGEIMGLVYFKRENPFDQADLETAEVLSIEIGSKLTELALNKKIGTERSGVINAFLSIFGSSNREEKMKVAGFSKMAGEFSQYLGMDKENAERIKYAAMLYMIFRSPLSVNFKNNSDPAKRFEEVSDELEYISGLKETILNINENFDGSGKPHGLKGDKIPEGARILKLIATYSTLSETSKYRSGEKENAILTSLENKSGSYFDPRIFSGFCAFIKERRREKQ